MSTGNYAQTQAPIKAVHSNLDQEVIEITEDKLRLVLNEHLKAVEKKMAWLVPFGIVLTIISVFVSTDFKDSLGLTAATWNAIFLIVLFVSTFWLVFTAINSFKAPTIEDVLDKIKNKQKKS